jgi:EGF domain
MYHDTYGCVDEEPPVIQLKHDPNNDKILRLRQGDTYTEYAVNIQDENAEEYLRSLKIAYSQPLPANKCFTKVGEFHVNYTVATPWTIPPYIRVSRRVIIDDIDECTIDVATYSKTCPELVPKCDPTAKCINTKGSYTCQCPKYTTGDGFIQGIIFTDSTSPHGYKGGQGCIDTTPPIVEVRGPNPKIFRVAKCTGITGIMKSSSPNTIGSSLSLDKPDLERAQQAYYSDDIKVRI